MKIRKIPANRTLTLLSAALCLAFIATAPYANAAGAGEDTVRSFYDTLLNNMRSGSSLGAAGRYARVAPVVRRIFDIPFMTRLAVGPEWANLTEAQRQQVSQAFERYVAAVYAERFDNYSGEKLQVMG
jgi:phospholipid transport system substrate-binding protein